MKQNAGPSEMMAIGVAPEDAAVCVISVRHSCLGLAMLEAEMPYKLNEHLLPVAYQVAH